MNTDRVHVFLVTRRRGSKRDDGKEGNLVHFLPTLPKHVAEKKRQSDVGEKACGASPSRAPRLIGISFKKAQFPVSAYMGTLLNVPQKASFNTLAWGTLSSVPTSAEYNGALDDQSLNINFAEGSQAFNFAASHISPRAQRLTPCLKELRCHPLSRKSGRGVREADALQAFSPTSLRRFQPRDLEALAEMNYKYL